MFVLRPSVNVRIVSDPVIGEVSNGHRTVAQRAIRYFVSAWQLMSPIDLRVVIATERSDHRIKQEAVPAVTKKQYAPHFDVDFGIPGMRGVGMK